MNGKEIISLAKQCGVPMHRACRRASVAPSTPWRWENQGQTPSEKTAERLEMAIFALANDAGTVPAELVDRCRAVLAKGESKPASGRSRREIIRSIRSDLRELEQATGA